MATLAQSYIARLEALHKLGVLQGRVLYPCMGTDIFPAYYADCFGINAYTGIGISRHCDVNYLERVIFNELGFWSRLKGKRKEIRIFQANVFMPERYVPEIGRQGGVDVLYVKGLEQWVRFYSSFPGGGTQYPKYADKDAYEHALKNNIRNLIGSLADTALKPGGFIVIADQHDLELVSSIAMELGFTDFLAGMKEGAEKALLLSGEKGKICFLGGLRDNINITLGEIPVRIFQKPGTK